jgi:type II secretion system protein J
MRNTKGFTLVELLLALTLFAMLASGGLAALSTGTRSAAKANRYNAMVSRGQGAMQTLTRDIRAAVLQEDSNLVSLNREHEGRPADTIDFIMSGMPRLEEFDPENTGRCEIDYYIENDPDTEIRWLVRREDASLDDDALGGGAISLAGPYVRSLELRFYDGILWQSGWVDEEGFPLAVSIEIEIVDEDEQENPITLKTIVPIVAA